MRPLDLALGGVRHSHQPIRNEHWPRNTDDFAVRTPIDVWVRIWWAHLWPTEVLPAVADRWGRWHVRVVLDPAGPRP